MNDNDYIIHTTYYYYHVQSNQIIYRFSIIIYCNNPEFIPKYTYLNVMLNIKLLIQIQTNYLLLTLNTKKKKAS